MSCFYYAYSNRFGLKQAELACKFVQKQSIDETTY